MKNGQWSHSTLPTLFFWRAFNILYLSCSCLPCIYYKICKQLIARSNRIHHLRYGNQMLQENDRVPTWLQSIKRQGTKTFLVSFTIVTCFILCACPAQILWNVSVISSKEMRELSSYYIFFNSLHFLNTAEGEHFDHESSVFSNIKLVWSPGNTSQDWTKGIKWYSKLPPKLKKFCGNCYDGQIFVVFIYN